MKIGEKFQLILNPIRDWKFFDILPGLTRTLFQLILNPIRDWKLVAGLRRNLAQKWLEFQLILNPIRDWKISEPCGN